MKVFKIMFSVMALVLFAPIAFLLLPFWEVLNDNSK